MCGVWHKVTGTSTDHIESVFSIVNETIFVLDDCVTMGGA